MHDAGWPDKDDFPYRALIRIRYSHEIDLVALDRMRAAVCHVAPPEIAREVTAGLTRVAARIASKAVDSLEPIRSEQSAERFDKLRESLVSGFLNAYDDDDWCGTGPHWWKHFRRPLPWPPPWESSWQGPGKEPWKIEAARSPASEGAAGSVE
ncbi:MAG: hypothetical protein QG608_2708, partial [Actinomycetota bacterium]|nr:hypothetical protein [Actinomycetota bacterium]